LITTVLTIVAISSVLLVYAAISVTFTGNAVTVSDIASGTVTYSIDGGSTFSASPLGFNVGGSLYTRFELTSTSYTGSATVTWQLQKDNSGTWTNVGSTVLTSLTLTGSAQTIYASDDGTAAGNLTPNQNWGLDISTGGSYRVTATVASE
jgi:hypothetical protein